MTNDDIVMVKPNCCIIAISQRIATITVSANDDIGINTKCEIIVTNKNTLKLSLHKLIHI